MSVTYSIDTAEGIARLHYAGETSFEEWSAVMGALFEDPEYSPGFGVLADRRHAAVPSTTFIRRVLAFTKAHEVELGRGRWAQVVDDPASYGMSRMAQILSGHEDRFQIFTDIEAAEAWLRRKAPSDGDGAA